MRFRFAVSCFAIASVCLAAKIARTSAVAAEFHAVPCEGTYPHHLQGICTNERDAIYWSFTTTLVKTDRQGKVLQKIPVASHHGDICFDDGKIYVAVNLGKFNDAAGRADSWVYVYDAGDLSFLKKHEVQQVFHGAGGIGIRNGQFFVVGGLPEGVNENYVYQYDQDFRFVKKHVINSGYTLMGIQTATFADGQWWFGCYGKPQVMLKTDESFRLLGKYEFDCSLGIVGLSEGRFLVARGRSQVGKGCSGRVMLAHTEPDKGLVVNDEITITVFEPPGKDLRPRSARAGRCSSAAAFSRLPAGPRWPSRIAGEWPSAPMNRPRSCCPAAPSRSSRLRSPRWSIAFRRSVKRRRNGWRTGRTWAAPFRPTPRSSISAAPIMGRSWSTT